MASLIPFRNICEYRYCGHLGGGSFGEVSEYTDLNTGERVAIKMSHNLGRGYLWELFMYEKIKKDGVNFFPECKAIVKKGLVFEKFSENASLSPHVRSRITKTRYLKWFKTLLLALDYLHSNGICHRDIKAENVLLKGNRIAMADLGSCIDILTRKTHEIATTKPYMAPELEKSPYDFPSDVWSLGVTFCYMLKGFFPTFEMSYDDMDISGFLFGDDKLAKYIETIQDPEINHLVSLMLKKDPKERINAREAFILLDSRGETKLTSFSFSKQQNWFCQNKNTYDYYRIVSKNKKITKQMRLSEKNTREQNTREQNLEKNLSLVERGDISPRAFVSAIFLTRGRESKGPYFFYSIVFMCSCYYDEDYLPIKQIAKTNGLKRERLTDAFWDLLREGLSSFDLTDPFESWKIFLEEKGLEKEEECKRIRVTEEEEGELIRILREDERIRGKSSIEATRQISAILRKWR